MRHWPASGQRHALAPARKIGTDLAYKTWRFVRPVARRRHLDRISAQRWRRKRKWEIPVLRIRKYPVASLRATNIGDIHHFRAGTEFFGAPAKLYARNLCASVKFLRIPYCVGYRFRMCIRACETPWGVIAGAVSWQPQDRMTGRDDHEHPGSACISGTG